MNGNNNYHPQGGHRWNQQRPYQGGNNGNSFNSNQPSFRDLIFGQAKINEGFTKKLVVNKKILDSLNVKFDGLSSALKNQLSFNKMLETQLAQLAAVVPSVEIGKISGQPESSHENASAVTMRGGTKEVEESNEGHSDMDEPPKVSKALERKKAPKGKTTPQEFFDTNILPFPQHNRKPSVDEPFPHFVEMIQKIQINVQLLEAMQVPTHARYLKDILSNKGPMPTSEVVKLTEECSTTILNRLPKKKKDPGCPTITCMIRAPRFDHALYDLGVSVSIMPKLQLVDSSVWYPAGIAKDILVRIHDCFVPVNFMVLDMNINKESLLILGHPFLSTTDARIDVGARVIRLHINGKKEKFEFRPRKDLISFMKNFILIEQQRMSMRLGEQLSMQPQKSKKPPTTPRKPHNIKTVCRKVGQAYASISPKVDASSSG
ncbi:hypothetical protein SETIT_9G277000v2 [Setaria italica]|uniref:Aspartic peptidase DDI1-type domain-containing protein n=1 Tax=Setaria italica TaxID=4555 RepID=A0A368SLE6_SETIT|nr:hypothetical protein SETIT_9G277000v2 [Setaria italica]